MRPSKAIAQLDQFADQLNRLRSAIERESTTIREHWDTLGAVGGQREDHAAALLERMSPALRAMAEYCTDCETQIANMANDPFAD